MASKQTGKRRTFRILGSITLGILPLLVIATALYSIIPDSGDDPHLTDDVLIANFQAHKPDFDRLLEMILQDNQLARVDRDWTEPPDPTTIGLTRERIDEYRRLFKKLGIRHGLSAPQTRDHVELLASTQGWVSHGSEKGYLYAEKSPDHYGDVVDDLNRYSSNGRPVGTGCRHIEGNWYLYLYRD